MKKINFFGFLLIVLGLGIMFFSNNMPSESFNLFGDPFFYGGVILLIGFIIMCLVAVIITERMVNPKKPTLTVSPKKPTLKKLPSNTELDDFAYNENPQNDIISDDEEVRRLHNLFIAPDNGPPLY